MKKPKTFKRYLESKGHSTKSIESAYRSLCRFLEWSEDNKIEEATYRDLLGYVQYLRKRGVKQITIQKYIGTLRHYFDWQREQDIRTDNPAERLTIRGVRRKHLYHILTRQELDSLYESYPMPEETESIKNQNWFKASQLTAKRNKVITGLLVFQGLKTEELGKLTEKDLYLREGKIRVGGGRKSNERELKLEALQILDLMEYSLKVRPELLKAAGKESEKLFVSNGKGNDISNMMHKLTEKLREANRKVESAKQIRASVITCWLKQYNLREVQYRAGHRYVSSTESYLINDLEDLQEEISKYHPID